MPARRAYDAAISQWFAGQNDETFPARVTVAGSLRQTLRYGENPHQAAAFYVSGADARPGIATATQLQGKELSYNNLNDTDAAFELVAEFETPRRRHHQARQSLRRRRGREPVARPMAARWNAIPSAPSAASSPSTARWTPPPPSRSPSCSPRS